jgi:hypothetical protein
MSIRAEIAWMRGSALTEEAALNEVRKERKYSEIV